jgi:hypothetical protein
MVECILLVQDDEMTTATNTTAALPFGLVRRPADLYNQNYLGKCAECTRQFWSGQTAMWCDVPSGHPSRGTRFCSERCAHSYFGSKELASAVDYMKRVVALITNPNDPRLADLQESIAKHEAALAAI